MWELPFSRALQYYHGALRYAGEWTIPVDPIGAKKKLEAAQAAIERVTSSEEPDEEIF